MNVRQLRKLIAQGFNQLDTADVMLEREPTSSRRWGTIAAGVAERVANAARRLGLDPLYTRGIEVAGKADSAKTNEYLSACLAAVLPTAAEKGDWNMREAAAYLGYSVHYLRELIRDKQIDCVQQKKWGRISFTKEMLDAFRERGTKRINQPKAKTKPAAQERPAVAPVKGFERLFR